MKADKEVRLSWTGSGLVFDGGPADGPQLVVDGDSATGTVYYAASGVTADGASFGANGYYGDTYVRTADGWKFLRREAAALLDPDYSDWDQAEG